MKISEIFLSIQGESSLSGFPTVFVRTSGCNLKCVYCDTKYARTHGEEIPIEDVVNTVSSFGVRNVMITGGEPMIQKDSITLMKKLVELGFSVSLETNGSISVESVPKDVHIVMDIKTPGSGCGNSFFLENISFLKNGDEVNFVLVDREDYLWAKDFMKHLPVDRITVNMSPAWGYLSPYTLSKWILEDRLPVRLNLQIHKFIFGEVRGR